MQVTVTRHGRLAVVKFPYSELIRSLVEEVAEGEARWDPREKAWLIPWRYYDSLLDTLMGVATVDMTDEEDEDYSE